MKRNLFTLGFLLILYVLSFSCGSENSGGVNAYPAWLTALINELASEPVADPPAKIIQYEYKGRIVYYLLPRCCDIMSNLYDSRGAIICHPDGGIMGQGDGQCPDFFNARSNGTVIWEDPRT